MFSILGHLDKAHIHMQPVSKSEKGVEEWSSDGLFVVVDYPISHWSRPSQSQAVLVLEIWGTILARWKRKSREEMDGADETITKWYPASLRIPSKTQAKRPISALWIFSYSAVGWNGGLFPSDSLFKPPTKVDHDHQWSTQRWCGKVVVESCVVKRWRRSCLKSWTLLLCRNSNMKKMLAFGRKILFWSTRVMLISSIRRWTGGRLLWVRLHA